MTFSIAARCADTGHFGIAIASSSPAVAARCAHVRAGVGAVSSQNVTDPRLGPAALDLMQGGASARAALAALTAANPHIDYRQLVAVDSQGRTATWSGCHTLGIHAASEGKDCAAAGNLLANDGVPAAMVGAFEAAAGSLASRLVAALSAGLAAGGEAGPVHSAGLLVAGTESWPLVDLRVDWDDADPIARLHALWVLWEPQMDAYVQRALDPGRSPSFGVPGDEA
jgi:uncharacterized Ntn-hydrolase superfamily protein